MKKIQLILIFMSVILTMKAQNIVNQEIGQFDKIKIDNAINVVYHCNPDSSGFISYNTLPDGNKPYIFTLNKGTLRIQLYAEFLKTKNLPVIHLYSDFMTSVTNSSTGTCVIANAASCPEFQVVEEGNGTIIAEGIKANKVSASIKTGNGSIVISGETGTANLSMLGTGTISADRLKAENVNCKILGTGTIACYATEKLKVSGVGSTKIYYKGEPQISKKGGGKLFHLPQDEDFIPEDAMEKAGVIQSRPAPSSVKEEDDIPTIVTIDEIEEEVSDEDIPTVVTIEDDMND